MMRNPYSKGKRSKKSDSTTTAAMPYCDIRGMKNRPISFDGDSSAVDLRSERCTFRSPFVQKTSTDKVQVLADAIKERDVVNRYAPGKKSQREGGLHGSAEKSSKFSEKHLINDTVRARLDVGARDKDQSNEPMLWKNIERLKARYVIQSQWPLQSFPSFGMISKSKLPSGTLGTQFFLFNLILPQYLVGQFCSTIRNEGK